MWKIISLLTLVTGFVTTTAPPKCCLDESVLLRNSRCWNPKHNEISAIAAFKNCKRLSKKSVFSITDQGELTFTNSMNVAVIMDANSFCLENQTTIKDKELRNTIEVALICSEEDKKTINDHVAGYCMIVSIVFLMITAIIYAALPQLRDVLGKSLISFCCTFAIGLTLMAIAKLTSYSDMTLCAIRGFLTYYFILAANFWTNAISIQILLSIRRPSTMSYKWRDFVWYAVYAWGSPGLLTLAMALVNFLPGDHPKPGIGLMHCWFYDMTQQWFYLYSVWTILTVANICIFVYTSVYLWRNTFSTSHIKALRYKFILTTRLFIVMGVTWIFEMISSLSHQYSLFWAIMDIYNITQGVMIFLVLVVFRRRVVKAMFEQGWLGWISKPVENFLAKVEDDEQDVVENVKEISLENKNCS